MQEKRKQQNEEPQKVTNASKKLKTITGDIKSDRKVRSTEEKVPQQKEATPEVPRMDHEN